MGNSSSKANKEFQAVIPYTPSSKSNIKRKKGRTQPRRPTVAPALIARDVSALTKQSEGDEESAPKLRRVPLRSPSICEEAGWSPSQSNFDFNNTEGQNRRELLASYEEECSMITPFLFVGGFKVANSLEMLKQNNITRVVNCSLAVVDNVFEYDESIQYLSLNMLDGRQDDVSWFVCEVINFIEIARNANCNTLVHCEKGVSRSCSFAICYIMWATGCQWKDAFDYVRERRGCCSPNTGFTCNLIEIDDLMHGDSSYSPLMFRLAQHLPHDEMTPVLKLIRNADSRNIIRPHFSYLSSDGVFIIRPSKGHNISSCLYVWKGLNVSEATLKVAVSLAEQLLGIFSEANCIEVVAEGSEGDEFKDNVEPVAANTIIEYDDLYESDTDNPVDPVFNVANKTSVASWATGSENSIPARLNAHHIISAKFLGGIDEFKKNNEVVLGKSKSLTKIKALDIKMNISKVVPSPNGNKVDELSEPNVVTTPGTPSTSNHVDNSAINNEASDERGKDERIDLAVLTPLNPVKENVNVTELQLPLTNAGEGKVESIIKVVSTCKDITRSKPVLFQCVTSSNECKSWQHMGMFDDDDLAEDSFLFLLCPEAPHHLWKGSGFEVNLLEVANSVSKFDDAPNDDINADVGNEKEDGEVEKIRKYAEKVIEVGEVPLTADDLRSIFLSIESVHVQMQGDETEIWWDSFNSGM